MVLQLMVGVRGCFPEEQLNYDAVIVGDVAITTQEGYNIRVSGAPLDPNSIPGHITLHPRTSFLFILPHPIRRKQDVVQHFMNISFDVNSL